MDLLDDDDEVVAKTIQLQKSLLSESISLHNTKTADNFCSYPPNYLGEQADLSSVTSNQTDLLGTNIDDRTAFSNALAANIEYDNMLAKLEANLKELIAECKLNLDELAAIRAPRQNKGKQPRSLLGRSNTVYIFGAPYFKDQNYYRCPPNHDVDTKRKNDELCFIDLPTLHFWSPKQTKQLVQTVRDLSLEACRADARAYKNTLLRQLSTLSQEQEEEKNRLNEELKNFNEEIFASSKLNEKIANADHDWLKISVSTFNGRYSAEECRGFWNNFLHPKFNKGPWTEEEERKLKWIVKDKNKEDWDAIAARLGTNRSGYQCFALFHSSTPDCWRQKWTKEEDEKLKAVVEKFRVGNYIPWGQVASHLTGRTKIQAYNRWTYSLDPSIKKGRFSLQEDIIILCGIKKWGRDFQKIAQYMTGRTAPQCRLRYYSQLAELDYSPWTPELDACLLEKVKKHGHDWKKISEYFPGKDRSKVRHRHATILKKIQANTLGERPVLSRSRRTLKCLNAYQDPELWEYAEKLLRSGIQSTSLTSTSLLPSKMPPKAPSKPRPRKMNPLDEQLYEYFVGVYRKPPGYKDSFDVAEDESKHVQQLSMFLQLLGAKLKIPSDEVIDQDDSLSEVERSILKALRKHRNKEPEPKDIDMAKPGPSRPYSPDPLALIDCPSADASSIQETFVCLAPFLASQSYRAPETPPEPVPQIPPCEPPLFGNLKYICPPNFTTLVGLRSILLRKRKLVESISNFATDPVLLELPGKDKDNTAYKEARNLWDDRLMFLFAFPNLLSKMNPPKEQNVDIFEANSVCEKAHMKLPSSYDIISKRYELEQERYQRQRKAGTSRTHTIIIDETGENESIILELEEQTTVEPTQNQTENMSGRQLKNSAKRKHVRGSSNNKRARK